ncbi:hypothetical protein [Streptomyces sp. NPDC059783]|uniref:hypothetical protein n=1 Tax=Streptomyces sp. NPDC059783 TaxID=3346944 RepID=UPI0036551EA5
MSPTQQLAVTMEAMYLKRGRTLTDPPTADAYAIALEAVALMLDGSLAQGVVDDEVHASLRGMVEGMAAAPTQL